MSKRKTNSYALLITSFPDDCAPESNIHIFQNEEDRTSWIDHLEEDHVYSKIDFSSKKKLLKKVEMIEEREGLKYQLLIYWEYKNDLWQQVKVQKREQQNTGKPSLKLTDSRKAKLVLNKMLEYAEIGGMEEEHCGMVLEAVVDCFDTICMEEGDELTMEGLVQQIRQILDADEWDFNNTLAT
ncbi:MAG: hypothetical protein CME33_15420 [Gimesia sp.]|uniref:hypothetical protein n=1 Tax=Gimesia sp. TaxID=2024833 RepID=UPI000C6BAFDE|nr:hypothetical protein [Gimesia sp.]MAX37944.1 hypothetical protein [Gimesia sp.]|tara:strand:+ start:805 stop:1353 length:549 start_codon:yes stop_codon:yes gene_type:complete